jgi:hypothetical protein
MPLYTVNIFFKILQGVMDMAYPVDKLFFQQLAQKDPKEICRRALCRYDWDQKKYRLSIWQDEYAVYPFESKIEQLNQDVSPKTHDYLFIFIIHYLLSVKAIWPLKKWISEKEMPSGGAFFRGPHEIPTHLISKNFANDIKAFKVRCKNLSGTPLDMADAAYSFQITPRIPIAVLFWQGDEDFDDEAKLLFDPSIARYLALDAIYALAVYVCAKIGKD